ncbi:MAG: hypothetical protein GX796_12175, partial [Clostridiaceae bacterium]|nr:hypothetical protein [Clostridiaceae bacterium]
MYKEFTARGENIRPEDLLNHEFSDILSENKVADAIFADSSFNNAIGVAGTTIKTPVVMELFKNKAVSKWLRSIIGESASVLIVYRSNKSPEVYIKDEKI